MQSDEKPRLVPAGQGFCSLNTVQYKNRFLYSKYNPEKAILQTIQSLTVLPQTLVIVCSPVLWYGIDALLEKCDNTCTFVAYEADDALFELSEKTEHPKSITLYHTQNETDLDRFIRNAMQNGTYRRAIRVDLSAGVQFAQQQYEYVANACEEIIAAFWKSRITITRLGKLFAKNTLTNIAHLSSGTTLTQHAQSITKPILVFGAGESLDDTVQELCAQPFLAEQFYIIAVDAALSTLTDAGIIPDAAVAMESQFAIQNAYCGLEGKPVTLFADIVSRPQVTEILGGKTVWFASRYADCTFLDDIIQRFFKGNYVEPLGSVGLGAVQIALTLRKDTSIPVYVTGLDFSFSAGRTHAKNTPAHKTQLNKTNRLTNGSVYAACFNAHSSAVLGKDNKVCYSTPVLQMYGKLFIQQFAEKANVFDTGKTGLPLGLPQAVLCDAAHAHTAAEQVPPVETALSVPQSDIQSFYENELQSLLTLRDLLSNGENAASRDTAQTLSEQIQSLLVPREYLYLHFPDGYRLSMDSSFLKRIRAELDSFIKTLQTSQRLFP